jgi:hypothetical protein
MTLAKRKNKALDKRLAALAEAGHPVIQIVLNDTLDLK